MIFKILFLILKQTMATYKCSDNIYRTLKKLKEELLPYSNNGLIFQYKNYQYAISCFDNNQLNGYVISVNENQIHYEPHGGITGGYLNRELNLEGIGFDCSHYNDITISAITISAIEDNYLDEDMVFKMPSFIHEECKKMIDSILE